MRKPSDRPRTLKVRYDARYIVSDEHQFVYFVLQKAACSSIKTALMPLFDIDPDAPEAERVTGNRVIHELYRASGYLIDKGQFVAQLNGKYRDYFKFTFVRNPWDRLVSCYSERVVDSEKDFEPSDREGFRLGPDTSFAEFVETVCAIPDDEANIHFRSQHKTVCGPGEDRPIMANFVGRFENLTADFGVVAERISNAPKLQLPYKHRSKSRKSRSYVEFYDERLRDLVYERFREDVEIFGYSFGDPNVPPPLWQDSRRPERDEAEELRERNRDLEQAVELLSKRNADLEQDLRFARKRIQQLRAARTTKSSPLLERAKRLGRKIVAPSSER